MIPKDRAKLKEIAQKAEASERRICVGLGWMTGGFAGSAVGLLTHRSWSEWVTLGGLLVGAVGAIHLVRAAKRADEEGTTGVGIEVEDDDSR